MTDTGPIRPPMPVNAATVVVNHMLDECMLVLAHTPIDVPDAAQRGTIVARVTMSRKTARRIQELMKHMLDGAEAADAVDGSANVVTGKLN